MEKRLKNGVCHPNVATFREEYVDHVPINMFTAITLNSITLSKEILISQYMRENKIDFAVLIETWFTTSMNLLN